MSSFAPLRNPAGRRRWIVYKDKFDYNPTTIPPEWHGWLNYINDYNPTNTQFKQPTYQVGRERDS